MPSVRILLAVLALAATLLTGPAHAARVFPDNSFQARIRAIDGEYMEIRRGVLHFAPGLLIYTPNNTTLVKSALPVDVFVRIQLDGTGDVRRIWILADDEIVIPPWWRFWNREETQDQPGKDQMHILPYPE